MLHNRHWKILLRDGWYWLQPPVEIDPGQTLIALSSKNPLMHEPLRLDASLGAPLQLEQASVDLPGADTADNRQSRDGWLDGLDLRDGRDPILGHVRDDGHP